MASTLSSLAYVLVGILGIATLMIVHEGGHYFAARRFGMRVTKFSIGIGPTLWKHRPKDSPTTFQVAIIPFLAYVQIAGMNPYEESDPNDAGSYANASLWGRIVTIAAGSLANYLFASILFFAAFMLGGNLVVDEASMRVNVLKSGPAAQAGMKDGDRILAVNGTSVRDWDHLKQLVGAHPDEKIDVEIERGSERVHVTPTPIASKDEREGERKGMIQIMTFSKLEPVTAGQAAVLSVKEPPKVVYLLVTTLARVITHLENPGFRGPVGIVTDVSEAARDGSPSYFRFLGIISAYLGGFNLLPVPALDGGRLIFLGFEAASRRRADAKVEAKVHALGLMMFLALLAFVTFKEIMPKKATPAAASPSAPARP